MSASGRVRGVMTRVVAHLRWSARNSDGTSPHNSSFPVTFLLCDRSSSSRRTALSRGIILSHCFPSQLFQRAHRPVKYREVEVCLTPCIDFLVSLSSGECAAIAVLEHR